MFHGQDQEGFSFVFFGRFESKVYVFFRFSDIYENQGKLKFENRKTQLKSVEDLVDVI